MASSTWLLENTLVAATGAGAVASTCCQNRMQLINLATDQKLARKADHTATQ